MRLAALLVLFAACAFGQTKEIGLGASHSFVVGLTPDMSQVITPFPVDAADEVDISVTCSSISLRVTLIDPTGNSHAAGSTDSIVTGSAFGDPEGIGIMNSVFKLTNPPAGMWTLVLHDTVASGKNRVALFWMTSSSELVAGLLGADLDYPINMPFSVAFLLLDSQGGLPSGSVASVDATLQLNQQPPTTITFKDDGLGDDLKANDGIYTATTQVSRPGEYSIFITAKGTWKGQPFTRTAAGVFNAVSPCITLDGTFQPSFQAGSGLTLTFGSQANQAVNVRASAELTSANGNQVNANSFTDVRSGANSLSVFFPMEWLAALQANGPYQISTVTLGCVDPQSLHAATSDQMQNLGLTGPVNLGVTGPGLSLSPQQLDFGALTVGQTRDLKVILSNAAAAGITVNSLTASGPFVVPTPSTPIVVGAGQGVDVTVRFTPASTGSASGSLRILSTDPVNPLLAVTLKGTANAISSPKIALSSSNLSFGTVTIGQSSIQTLTISNNGNATLNVTSLSTAAPFAVVAPNTPFTVSAGGTVTVTVRFTPASASVASGTLGIGSNDPAQPVVSVSLTGSGAPLTTAGVLFSDSFNRPSGPPCVFGQADLALGGSGTHLYLPIFVGGASLAAGTLQNSGLDYGGVQFTASLLATCSGRGDNTGQNLNLRVDLLVPSDASGHITEAGPYIRSRAAAPNDGIIGGTSSGYWVELLSTGEVKVKQLNPQAFIAASSRPSSFDATVFHTLEIAAQGSTLQAMLDGQLVVFNTGTTVSISAGANDGAAGISFGAEENRGQMGGQRARNLVVSRYRSLSGPPPADNPAITVSPANLDFGTVSVGQFKTLSFTLQNTGAAALSVSSFATNNTRFTTVAPATPLQIPSGGQQQVTVQFAPNATGTQLGILTIASNDPTRPTLTVTLTGTGAAAQPATVVLQVDGGTLNQAFGFPNGQARAAFVNRLTPPSYPATIQNVQIYFGNRMDGLAPNTSITLVYGANSSGSANFSSTFTLVPAQVGTTGVFKVFPVTPLTITAGDFIVGFIVDNPVGIYPADLDMLTSSKQRSYFAAGDLAFTLLDVVPNLSGNLAIRATVALQ